MTQEHKPDPTAVAASPPTNGGPAPALAELLGARRRRLDELLAACRNRAVGLRNDLDANFQRLRDVLRDASEDHLRRDQSIHAIHAALQQRAQRIGESEERLLADRRALEENQQRLHGELDQSRARLEALQREAEAKQTETGQPTPQGQ